MVFHFEIAKTPYLVTIPEFKDVQKRWAKVVEDGGWITQYLTNHDSPRQISRFGDDKEYRVESGKMLAMLMHTLPGTIYVYQGEEIGMVNADFPSIEYYNEKYTVGKYYTMVEAGEDPKKTLDSLKMMSRVNVRTPMQWDESENAGFSKGKPWLTVNPTYKEINVERDKKNHDSIYYTYKRLIAMRKQHPVMVYGTYTPVMEDVENLVAYIRKDETETWFMLFNFQNTCQEYILPDYLRNGVKELLMGNYRESDEKILKPYEGRIYALRK